MAKSEITIFQEPLGVRDAVLYKVLADVWYDIGGIEFRVNTTPVGNPNHFLVFDNRTICGVKQPIDLGHSIEEASQKAYEHAMALAKDRVDIGKQNSGGEVYLVDKTVRGKSK